MFLGVGSNVDPVRHIEEALLLLKKSVKVLASSTFYWTTALHRPEQRPFLNGCWLIQTDCPPLSLKEGVLKRIEARMGRLRTKDKWADRSIDLDVLLWADRVEGGDICTLPHPDIRDRPFVAIPLLELEPDLKMPDTGERLDGLDVVLRRDGLTAAEAVTTRLKKIIAEGAG